MTDLASDTGPVYHISDLLIVDRKEDQEAMVVEAVEYLFFADRRNEHAHETLVVRDIDSFDDKDLRVDNAQVLECLQNRSALAWKIAQEG